ncbi:Peroxisomal membrane protein 2 [Seminavis robusta]|uniref:Peroxisomal membrane protein 2 n=1 Tax=Seminavis robusta TaxID=568900 RepID=A0A9N8H840_9STRA|nr:Peroxisomal membrane protein 2 [Seminavis robusta]|eukprot:Sro226_g092000.1 Peroxisomal membrane protein 2 (465) ;mRNA; f:22549-23943
MTNSKTTLRLLLCFSGFCARAAFSFTPLTLPIHTGTGIHSCGQPALLAKKNVLVLHPQVRAPAPPTTSTQLQLGLDPHNFWITQQAAEAGGSLLQAYGDLLRHNPIATKGITAAILAASGDAIAQWRSDSEEYDPIRGAGFFVFGALYTGVFQHFWFEFMNTHIHDWGDALGIWGPERVSFPVQDVVDKWSEWWKYFDVVTQLEQPPSSEALAAAKVAFNQFLTIPFVYMPLFFTFTGFISGLDSNESMARAESLYFPLLQRNWLFWLPMQFLQFLVIPADYQIPFISAASLVWTVILSSIGAGSAPPVAPSQIVAYETITATSGVNAGDEIVTVLPVEPGDANTITDNVRLEDVIPTTIMANATTSVVDPITKWTAGGLTAGLLASAADEGVLGAAVGAFVDADPGVGVAAVTVAAGLGSYLAASAAQSNQTDATQVDSDADSDHIDTVFGKKFSAATNATLS